MTANQLAVLIAQKINDHYDISNQFAYMIMQLIDYGFWRSLRQQFTKNSHR